MDKMKTMYTHEPGILLLAVCLITTVLLSSSMKAKTPSENMVSAVQLDGKAITGIIDLKGNELHITSNATLKFEGGKIINGTIVFDNTKLLNPHFENCRFKGSVADSYFNARDYGILPNNNDDCSLVINDLIKLKVYPANNNNPKHIYLPQGIYYIDQPIELFAGFESPVYLYGDGNMTCICQRTDNEYILKVFEQNHIKDLKLSYKNKQDIKDKRSVAIACQRSVYSVYENLTICKSYIAFGYISLKDQKQGNNPTGYLDQCYVSDNFRNIRIYESSGYAFDFKKEFSQGDSGSAYDNIYISNNTWLGESNETQTAGAIRGDNTMASFTQLNIEGYHYSSSLIDLQGFSRVSIQTLHIEGLKEMPNIIRTTVHSMISLDIIDIQHCTFTTNGYNMFVAKDKSIISIDGICLRTDCTISKGKQLKLREGEVGNIKINNMIDGTKTIWR